MMKSMKSNSGQNGKIKQEMNMDNFEQINQRLVEISDSIKQHRTEWQSVVKEASLSQQIAIKEHAGFGYGSAYSLSWSGMGHHS
jgi:hypothetical protein